MIQKNILTLSKENLCNKCPSHIRGICCYYMTFLDNSPFTLTNHPCKYLNKKTGRCKIYNKRKEIHPNCLTIEEMYICGSFPKDCPYVKNDINYQNRKDTRKEPSLINTNFSKELNEINNETHNVIGIYDTLRTPVCPKCHSNNFKEEWDDKFSILFFRYECGKCGYKWNMLKKQINFTFKLIKKEL